MKPSVLITGAYGGMGRATARAFAEKGFCVFALDKTVQEAEENIFPIATDVTRAESVEAAFAQVKAATDTLAAVIHFAGVYRLDSLVEMENEDFEGIFKINLGGAFLVNKIFLPLLSTGAHIIITTSELAPLDPLPFTGVYAVTKAALDKYAYALRMELQLKEIFVSVLRAGAVDTGMLGVSTAALERFCQRTRAYTYNADRFKRIVDRVEAKHVPPEAIAKKMLCITGKRRPRFAYAINRNPLLLLLHAMPKRLQLWVIRQILKSPKGHGGK